MKNALRRIRVSTLKTGLPLLVFASSALLAGCSSGTKLDESVSGREAQALLTIPPPDPLINSHFGSAVAADTQTLIIGDSEAKAPATDGIPRNKGQVHIYTRGSTAESWQPLQILKPFGPVSGEVHFGISLALHGNLLVVAANRDALDCGTYPCPNSADDGQQGAFYVYTRTAVGQPFTPVGTKYTDPSPIPNGRFARLIATNGQYIAAAAGVLDGGQSPDVRIYTIQQNGSIVYSYSIDPTLRPLSLAMTENGILAVVPGTSEPVVRAYQLQASQAVALGNSASLGTGYSIVVANGNTVAAFSGTNGGRVVMAPVSAAGVGTVTTVATLGLTNPLSLSLLENQRFVVGDRDSVRSKVAKYDLIGGTWTNTGFFYPALSTHITGEDFGTSVALTNDFVAEAHIPAGNVWSVEATGSRLEGATFEKQRIQPTDACGANCSGQNFAGAEFGRESALSGDVAAVTQPDLNNTATRNPSVQIYSRQSGTWSRAAGFTYAGKGTRDVAVDSGRVYVGVGTPGSPGSSFTDGAVQVYERNASQVWTNVATLVASDPTSLAGKQVGDYIAASGDIVAVGAYQFVYIFQRSAGGSWSQIQKLPIGPVAASLGQPFRVALSPTYLVVGAPYDGLAAESGSVFVYRRSDWGLEQKFPPTYFSPNGSHFGYSVAIDGTTILVGAPDGGSNGGYVEVIDRTGSGTTPWVHTDWLNSVSGFDYRVGTSISIVGNQALLGAVGDPLTGPGSGAAYLFRRVNGVWDEKNGHVLLPGDYGQFQGSFGWGVNLSGTSALITAPPSASSAGEGYFFDGLVDADNDGLLASEDCNDSDGIAVSCALGGSNLSFEPAPRPQWTADSGSFTLSTTHTDGTTSAQLGNGVAKLSSPLFSTTLLHDVGTTVAIDIQRPSNTSNAVTLFLSAPALNINVQPLGTIDLSAFPVGAWKTASVTIPSTLRNVLLNQNTNVRFTLQFNAAAPGLRIDNLRFAGLFSPRSVALPSGSVTATLTTNSSNPTNYCMALKLGNSGTAATSTWSVVINTNGTTINPGQAGAWNASFSGTTGTVTITNNQTWNASIPAGATAYDPSVGFCATRPSGTAVATVVSASGQ